MKNANATDVANEFATLFPGGGSQQVAAKPDARTQSVTVTAPKGLMDQIGVLKDQLDVPSDRDQSTYVFSVTNADPYQVVQELQGMFNSTTRNNNQQNGAFVTRRNSGAQNMGVAAVAAVVAVALPAAAAQAPANTTTTA